MFLHLDQTFKPFEGPEIAFESFTFTGGEPHIKIRPDFDRTASITVTHRLNSFNDLGLLCLATDALQRMGADLSRLFIPYFPAARQDRLMVEGEPLSVKVYAQIINNLGYKQVLVFDPHSEVTPALLDHCKAVTNHRFVQQVVQHIGADLILISPDGGALKKIYKVSEFLGGTPVVECSKSRDVKTGQLSGFKVNTDNLEGKPCLIVDDICDGGGTFMGLAETLKSKNAGKLYLAVSHGIFSKGFDELEKTFDTIYTTNSFRTLEHRSVVQIPVPV